MGMKIMDTMRMTTVSPRPGRKKSMNFRLPGRTIRVLVPLPTGVRNGADAATQMAMATAVSSRSPVIMTTWMPAFCTSAMAWASASAALRRSSLRSLRSWAKTPGGPRRTPWG